MANAAEEAELIRKATGGNNVRGAALLLLECVRRGSFARLFDSSGVDASELEKEISRQKLNLMVANDTCDSVSSFWRKQVVRRDDTLRRVVTESIDLFSRRFEAANVRAVVLKGPSFEKCIYGSRHLRDLGDIDLLVSPADVDVAHKALLDLGYQQQIGPSSATGAASKGYAAIYAAQRALSAEVAESSGPLRRNPRKHEYIPYVKTGHPTVELHDGFCGLSARFTKALLGQTGGAGCHLIVDPAANLVLLLASAYENSESFYSNAFDRALVLRDYVDLRRFFERYRDELDWSSASALIESVGMRGRAGVVLRNLDDIFGNGADFGCLSGVERLPSAWSVGVAERLMSDDTASGAALSVFRNRLAERARSLLLPILGDSRILPADGRDVGFSMVRREGSLFAVWSIPGPLFGERYLYQVCFYPLRRDAKMLAYKIDLGYYDGELRAYGHATSRLLLRAAVLKKTNCGIPVKATYGESHVIVEMRLGSFLGRFGIDFEADEFAVSISVCEWNHGNVFWDVLPESIEVLEGVELGRVGLLSRKGHYLSLRFSEELYLLSVEDDELVARFREAFPQAVDGWLVNRDMRKVRSLRIAGHEDGPLLAVDAGSPAEVGSTSVEDSTGESGATVEAQSFALASNPDLILDAGYARDGLAAELDALQQSTGIPCVFLDISFGRLAQAFEMLGSLVGAPDPMRAATLAAYVDAVQGQTLAFSEDVAARGTCSVFYAQRDKGLMVRAGIEVQHDAIAHIGAVPYDAAYNYASRTVDVEMVSPETVDLVVFDDTRCLDQFLNGEGEIYESWCGSGAIEQGRFVVSPALMHSWFGSPILVQTIGLLWLTQVIWPEYYARDLVQEAETFYALFYNIHKSSAEWEELIGAYDPRGYAHDAHGEGGEDE